MSARPSQIALLSLACRFPDAASPSDLWRNALRGRRAFRALPPQRLDLRSYAPELVGPADAITPVKAGLLVDWVFDRAQFRIPAPVFAAADLTHWLALEVAADAIARLGGIAPADRARTAVVVGNTLTGEFSRAALLRLRGPFLDRVLQEAAAASLTPPQSDALRARFAEGLRACFPEPDEESLAGGLANTIAGRIANFFDLNGGAFSVDAACASSLAALAQAAELLAAERADVVVAGAVDLSLDPFELVGFTRNAALARDDMRVFDARAEGFWPAEGAGFAVLMREDAARVRGLEPLAVLRGWGMSSDGAGGLTRPTVGGQVLAVRRAHAMADVDPCDTDFVEAHGTGTPAGDPVEIRALAAARADALRPLPIGSIKGNIGHAKAAAGFAGLIKAVETLRRGVLPPHVGCETPHPVFAEVEHRVRPAVEVEVLPPERSLRAGVSGFGFGGVNVHLVLEGPRRRRTPRCPPPQYRQDAELFVLCAGTGEALVRQIERLGRRAESLGWSEFADAAAQAWREAQLLESAAWRAAVVADRPEALVASLDRARDLAVRGVETFDPAAGVFISARRTPPAIGLLFPGQAAPSRLDAGAWERRFPGLCAPAGARSAADPAQTAVAQPAIAAACRSGLQVLETFGIQARAALGHSLGEIAALAWAGALEVDDLVRLAEARGAVMAAHGEPGGAMVRVAATPVEAADLAFGLGLAIACENGEAETVLAGPTAAVEQMEARARARGVDCLRLGVSHAFHSAMFEPAVEPWRRELGRFRVKRPVRRVVSSVTGGWLDDTVPVNDLLVRQLVRPVLFARALRRLAAEADLLIEVGPGAGLTRLAAGAGTHAVTLDAFGPSLAPLLQVLGAAFAFGAPVAIERLFADRALRPIDLDAHPVLLASPCGSAGSPPAPVTRPPAGAHELPPVAAVASGEADPLDLVRSLTAAEAGLTLDVATPQSRFLSDLHLNSLAVGRIVARAAHALGLPPLRAPTEFADRRLEDLAEALRELLDLPTPAEPARRVAGVRPWIRTYQTRWTEASCPGPATSPVTWRKVRLDRPVEVAGERAGTAVLLEGPPTREGALALIELTRAAIADPDVRHFALVHDGWPVSGFARSLAQEGCFASVRVVGREAGADGAAVHRELEAAIDGFAEVRLGADGARSVPEFVPTSPRSRARGVGPDDVALVVGGGRGVAAECALALAARTGCAMILCGRSPAEHAEVAAVLARAEDAGLRCRYVQTDVLDPAGFATALGPARIALGDPTLLIHAAGVNEPTLARNLTPEILDRTLGPKTVGFRAAIDAAGPQLRRVIAFGSIIGALGLAGESHYALANAWQAQIASELARERPDCAVLSLDWTIWGGVGMGERLGVIERLVAAGVDPLGVDEAVECFARLVSSGVEGEIAVTGRFGPPPYLRLGGEPLAALRFLDRPVVHFPGQELVVETELSPGRDPYLDDHKVDGRRVLPGVLALEAMAQAAAALTGERPRRLRDVRFEYPVTVEEGAAAGVQIAALAAENGSVETTIRCAEDDFVRPCVRAVFDPSPVRTRSLTASGRSEPAFSAAPLYGPLFFHDGRFRRLARVQSATSRAITAEFAPARSDSWFGAFEDQTLLLGDPGRRDAALHALQATVPHKRLLPVSVDRISLRRGGPPARVRAVERAADGRTYTFDIFMEDATGSAVEVWLGARFASVGPIEPGAALACEPALLRPYLERLAREALEDDDIAVALAVHGDAGVSEARARVIALLGIEPPVARGDGRPVPTGRGGLSLARRDGLTLGVSSGRTTVACDLEAPARFADTPSPDAEAFALPGEAPAIAAARAWCFAESLRKLGRLGDRKGALVPQGAATSERSAMFISEDGVRVVTAVVPGPLGDMVAAIGAASPPTASGAAPRHRR